MFSLTFQQVRYQKINITLYTLRYYDEISLFKLEVKVERGKDSILRKEHTKT